MTDESADDELARLRAEVESHRQRELAGLRSALSDAREDASRYRAEAMRISELAKRSVAMYEQQIAELRGRLGAARNGDAHDRRFGAARN